MQDGGESTRRHILYGKLTSPTLDAHGKYAFVKLVAPGGKLVESGLYMGSCAFSGSTCDYKILSVEEGEYNVFGLIDLNANASTTEPVPDTGDFVTKGTPLMIWERTQQDFPPGAWIAMP
jgi:hypothetical protein